MNITGMIEDRLAALIDGSETTTEREEVIELLDKACDDCWGELVQVGLITEYTVDDLVATAAPCAEIIKYANEHAWVEDDNGLWEGLTYGVLASIAYFSLRNCFHYLLSHHGVDTNDDYPFANH